ncbi:MAG: DUF1700 domain-containing protein [Oscillospiraceae bacterium]|jgi:hypothetical protein|nr:DUF1700 domain-containing protein [Oscillospiraceae bacterium]
MEKQKFLGELRKELRWTFAKEETEDILRDYEGFFAAGASEGKTDAEICADLGSPPGVALSLAETLGKKRPFSRKAAIRAGAAALLLIPNLLYFLLGNGNPAVTCAALLVETAALWSVLGFFPPVARRRTGAGRWPVLCGHLLLGGLTTAAAAWFWSRSEVLALGNGGASVDTAGILFAASAAAIAVFGIVWFYKRSAQAFTLTVHALGAVGYVSAAGAVFSRLSDPDAFNAGMREALWIYLFALLLTAFVAALIRDLGKRVK